MADRRHGLLLMPVGPGDPTAMPCPGSPRRFRNGASTQCLQEGTPGAQIIPELAPHAGEPIVTHTRLSAFKGTELELMLRARGIASVLVMGVATNVTVEGTARDAVDLGYRTSIVAGACAAADAPAHDATLATFGLLGSVLNFTDLAAAFGRG